MRNVNAIAPRYLLALLLFAIASLKATPSHASSQSEVDYQCGAYGVELKGPDITKVFDADSNELAEGDYQLNYSGNGTLLTLRVKGHRYGCTLKAGGD